MKYLNNSYELNCCIFKNNNMFIETHFTCIMNIKNIVYFEKTIQNTWKYIYENTDDEFCEILKSVEIICYTYARNSYFCS
jgi:hypothetical protein